MDFSYENNKGLHAFFLCLVMILGIFTVFAPVKSYALTSSAGSPTAEFRTATVKFKTYANVYSTIYSMGSRADGFPNTVISMYDDADAKKMTKLIVYNATTKQDISDKFVIDYAQNRQARVNVKVTTEREKLVAQGDEIHLTYVFNQLMPKDSVYEIPYDNLYIDNMIGTASFLKTVPALPAQPVTVQAKAVQELPTVLGKVAGIVTLVGCLILGILLAVGLVRRLISLFLR